MQAKPTPLIYLASVASESNRKKAVQGLKRIQNEIQSFLSENTNIKVIIEGKEGQPYGLELLGSNATKRPIRMLHLHAENPITEKWYLNSDSGRRKPLEGEKLLFDQLEELQLVILEGGASLVSVEQLLFAGIPQVLALTQEGKNAQAQTFRGLLYQTLLNGATFDEAFSQASEHYPGRFRYQEIPNDPFEYWTIKEEWEKHTQFPEGLYYLSSDKEILYKSLTEVVTPKVSMVSEPPPAIQESLYFCTQELRGQNIETTFAEMRGRESEAILDRAEMWREVFDVRNEITSVRVTEPTVAVEPPREIEEAAPVQPLTPKQESEPVVVQEVPKSEVRVGNGLREPSHVHKAYRSQNEDEDWVDGLVDQYRRKFTLSLPRTYRKAMAAVSLAAMLVALFSILTWKQISKQDAVELAIADAELYEQKEAFSSQRTYNILLLPFKSYMDCKITENAIEASVRDQLYLQRETEDLGIRIAFVNNESCPESVDDAKRLGQENKADLVIWGQYGKPVSDDNTAAVRYLSLDEKYSEVSVWLGKHVGKQALSEDLNQGFFTGNTTDISHWILGLSYLHDENYQSAISHLNQIDMIEETQYSIVYHMMAKCYQGLRLDDKALESYNEAICLNPDNAGAYHSRGRFYQKHRRIDLAIQDYDEVLRIRPQHSKATLLAKMLRKNFKGGEEKQSPAEEMNVTQKALVPNLDTNALLAEVDTPPLPRPEELLAKETNKDEVRKLLAEKEAELAAERRRKQRNRMQQLVVAIREYTDFISQYPDKASLYHQRGVAYEMLQQEDEAMADFSHALRLDPGLLTAYLDRGSLWVTGGQFEKALADYNEALRLSPQDPDIYAVRAELLRKLGRYASAEADARKAITLDPGNRRYQRLLGRISEELTSY